MSARVTWLGHSTALIDLDGTRVLTDPVLRPRVAHLRRTVASDWAVVDGIDAVLISHLHYDHLDLPSLRRLADPLLVVPRGAGSWLRRRRFDRVTEVDVGDEITVGRAHVRATFAEHDSTRLPFRVRTPALGYVLSGSGRVYFAGDTDLFPGMESLAHELDVALVPVAGWGARLPPGHL